MLAALTATPTMQRGTTAPTAARALQRELKVPEIGLATKIPELRGREEIPDNEKRGGGSDDVGDISWSVPTVSLSFPANFEAGPGHN